MTFKPEQEVPGGKNVIFETYLYKDIPAYWEVKRILSPEVPRNKVVEMKKDFAENGIDHNPPFFDESEILHNGYNNRVYGRKKHVQDLLRKER